MSYTLYYSLGAITVPANTINTQTSIFLPGEDYVPYGQPVDQSLLSLLQNFANVTPPQRPIPGQLWFDTNVNIMKVTPNGGTFATWDRIDGNGYPGGTNTAVQFNNAGNLGGNSNFTYNQATSTLSVIGAITATTVSGNLSGNFSGNISGTIVAPGANTQILFNDDGTVGGNAALAFNKSTETLTVPNVIGNVFVGNTLTLNGNATISGNLQVNGTATYVNVSNVAISDPIIGLGRGANNTPLTVNDGKDRGSQLWYYSGSEKSAFMGYDNSSGKMIMATEVTIASEIVTVNSYGNVLLGNIEATGVISGDGSGLTSINGANVSGATPVANYSTTAGTVETAAQPNITSVGTLTSLNVAGTITAGNIYANSGTIGALLLTGTLTTAAQPNITSVGTLTSLSVSGAVTAGSLAGGAATGSGASGTWGISVTGSAATAGTVTTAAQPNITSVGTLSSLIVSGPLTTTQLTTGATGTSGSITGQWTLGAGSTLEATYADLAERYVADAQYEPGTVVEFGGEYEVTLAEAFTNRVAGVVSTNAAYIMNGDCAGEHVITLALQGRVPCRVVGPVRKGDMMISAGNGEAMASGTPTMGTVIGKAIENFDGESGVIEVVIGRL
jgi:hypothetical protein